MLFCGISPRVTVKYFTFFSPNLMIPNFTLVSLGPLRRRMASWLVTFLPTKVSPSTLTILSPAMSPALSAGPLPMTFCTLMVS